MSKTYKKKFKKLYTLYITECVFYIVLPIILIRQLLLFQLRPRWHSYSSVKIRDTYNTLYVDSLKSAHSMQVDVISNEQIELLFESIIYQKGSSVLKMLNYTLSEEVFKKGLQTYLKKL